MKRLLKQPDFLGFSFLFLLVFLFLWQGTVAGKVLLPADTLYSFLPWEPYAASFGVGVPRNDLIADMVLQNYSWKELAKDSFLRGELPLWNPYVFTGVPFLAGGQAGVLYPIGLPLFTLLPTAQAYVWFIALHLLVGGLGTYVYLRAIDTGRWGALLAAVAFSLAGFLVVSFQWPQVVSAAVWLPVVLLCLEQLFKQVEERSLEGPAGVSSRWLGMPFWTLLGAVAVGLSLLAGHLEISFYLLFSVTAYALVRLALMLRELGPGWRLVKATAGAVLLVGLGCALAAVQLVPSYELLMENFRAGAATFGQVAGWALPGSQLLAFLMPDFFGNPTHHFYFDAIRGVDLPVVGSADLAGQLRSYPFWGLKNYVEGTAYLGLLPLILAGAALLLRRDRYTAFFAGYGLFALLLAFGTPLYALFFFGVPGFDQLHTPFRWLYPYSFCVIVLAGRGADALLSARPAGTQGAEQWCRRWLGPGVAFVGALVLIAAAFSRLGLPLSLGFASSLLDASAALQAAFPSPEMLYSYQLRNLFIFGMMLLLSGVALMLVRGAGTGMTSDRGPGGRGTHSFHPDPVEGRTGLAGGLPRPAARVIEFLRDKAGPVALLGVLTVDLVGFGWGLISFSDPRLMSFVPPALQWLQRDQEPYRIATYGSDDVLPPNSALLAGLHDVRGYESVIPRQYVEFWGLLEEPSQLLYNRLDRFTDPKALATPLLDLMNVKYVLTGQPLAQEGFTLVYQEEVFIYENQEVMPRAYAVFDAHDVGSELEARQLLSGRTADLRRTVVLQGAASESRRPASARPMQAARILHYGPNRVVVAVDMPQAGYLVLSDAFFPGWRAQDEGGRKLPVLRANAVFRAVALEPGHHTVTFTYFPDSLKLGLYISFLGGVLCLLTAAYWGWRRFYREAAETSVVRRVVKNSVTPMAGQVVARAVDFGFAIFMLRILGPTQYGGYAFAVVLIGYFAILTDFGLGTLLTREIARDPSQANRYVANSLIRLGALRSVRAAAARHRLVVFLALCSPCGRGDHGGAIHDKPGAQWHRRCAECGLFRPRKDGVSGSGQRGYHRTAGHLGHSGLALRVGYHRPGRGLYRRQHGDGPGLRGVGDAHLLPAPSGI